MSPTAPGRGVARSQAVVALALVFGGGVYGAACSRDTLIGIDVPPPGTGGVHGSGSGGHFGPGSGGTYAGGSGGAIGGGSGGQAGTVCSSVDLTAGVINACGQLTAAAFSPDGKLLAASGRDSVLPNLRVWQVSDGKLLYQVAQVGPIAYNVKFSPDGKLLALAGFAPLYGTANSGAAIFEAATGALVTTLPTRSGPYASALAFSQDGKRLVTAGQQSFIDVWRVADWSEIMAVPHDGTIYDADFSPDDSQFLTSGGSSFQLWNSSDYTQVAEVTNLFDEENQVTFSPNGHLILSTAGAGQLQILDRTAMTLQVMTFNPPSGQLNPIGHAVWIDDSHFVADDWHGNVEEWSKDPAQAQGPFTLTKSWSLPGQAWGFAVSPDCHTVVVTGDFGFQVLAL